MDVGLTGKTENPHTTPPHLSFLGYLPHPTPFNRQPPAMYWITQLLEIAMGLDVYFNKAKALAAGMVISEVTNGNPDEATSDDEDYNKWILSKTTVTQVPGTDYLVNVWVGDKDLSIRANRWGNTYAPLTQWLKDNNITWVEG